MANSRLSSTSQNLDPGFLNGAKAPKLNCLTEQSLIKQRDTNICEKHKDLYKTFDQPAEWSNEGHPRQIQIIRIDRLRVGR
jgi:hypothetical protein